MALLGPGCTSGLSQTCLDMSHYISDAGRSERKLEKRVARGANWKLARAPNAGVKQPELLRGGPWPSLPCTRQSLAPAMCTHAGGQHARTRLQVPQTRIK